MKRKIKFRAWDDDSQDMVYLDLCPDDCFFWIDHNGVHAGTIYHRNSSDPMEPPEPETREFEEIMQFTGLHELGIYGNEVYEGDIIENCDTKALQVVFWNNEKAAWYCRYIEENRIVSLENSIGNINKVVGNIHEHPNLLKP